MDINFKPAFLQEKITNRVELKKLNPNNKGYIYICECVLILLDDISQAAHFWTVLDKVASMYHTNANTVNRNMTYCLKKAGEKSSALWFCVQIADKISSANAQKI